MSQVQTTSSDELEIGIQVCDCGNVFEQERGYLAAKFDKNYPPSRSQVLDLETCLDCAEAKAAKNPEMAFYSTTAALNFREDAARVNAERIAIHLEVKHRQRQIERTTSLARALRREHNKGFVNDTLANAKPRREGPRPQHRHHKNRPKIERNPNAPKKFGDEGSRRIVVMKSAKKQKEEAKAAKKAAKQQRGR